MTPVDLFTPTTNNELTVLSYGGGQDSSAILEMLIDDKGFRNEYAPNRLLVVMSDTGDEFDETYAHVERTKQKCLDNGIEFVFITSDMGFHSESWLNLRHFYRTHTAIGSKAYPKTCSDRLKIQPIYRFLEDWLSKNYGTTCNKKKGFYEFAATHGKINMMVGISKGEEKRASKSSDNPNKWYRENVTNIYPLLDKGMDRQACQDYLHSKDMYVIPSNCKACPFLSLEELEYLRRFHPESLDEWVGLEAAKLKKHKAKNAVLVTDAEGEPVLGKNGLPKTKNKNYGVFGVKPLTIKMEEAKKAFSDWSDDRVREYRYSHGHCVSTAY